VSGYTLYDTRQTGGAATAAALAELDIDYEHIEVDTRADQQFSAEFTRVNPRQQVPVLRLPNRMLLTEGIAILLHLADAHPEAGLAPRCGTPERDQLMRWLSFFATNVYEGESRRVRPYRYTTDKNGAAGVKAAARDHIARHYQIFEEVLRDGPYWRDERFSILDIYVWMLVQWWGEFDWLERECPKVTRLVITTMARPSVEPVHLAHFGPGLGLN
jgi:glutathione S-transferase